MYKILILISAVTLLADIPMRNTRGKEYLIVGQNTIQKIFYKTSSNFSQNHGGNMALDSDKKSAWISAKQKGPHWFEIDFRVKRIISKIVVHFGRKNNYKTVKSATLQFMYNDRWFDFKNEKTVKKRLIGYKIKETVEFDLGGIDASTFRILIPENATFSGYAAISEIETYIGTAKIKYYDERLKGLCFPIKNGFLPEKDYSYPNSPRKYRGGRHVGLDIFYYHEDDSYDPVPVSSKIPVLAASDGVILRADWHYEPMKTKEWKKLSGFYKKNPRTFVKRSFGGIQIWIDHQDGVITTYNHLSKIDPSIKVGKRIKKGKRIGWVGNSGLLGETQGKSWGEHLHFEIWVDGFYLGYGMSMKDVRKYITWMFFPLQ